MMAKQNNICLSNGLVRGEVHSLLDIEMETGTGKTYIYIKIIHYFVIIIFIKYTISCQLDRSNL